MSKAGISTKKELMENAIKIIQEKGYKNTTLEDICEASGITKGTFYYHFKSKEELVSYFYISNMNQLIKDSLSNIDSMVSAKNSWEQLLLVFEPSHILCASIGPEVLMQVMIANTDLGVTPFQLEQDNKPDLITTLIAKGQKEGVFQNQSEAAVLSRALKYAAKGVAWHWCTQKALFDKVQEFEDIFAAILDLRSELR